jgi:hypothetical protein
MEKALIVSCSVFGAFTLTSNLVSTDSSTRVSYIPTPEILNTHNFKYEVQHPVNIEASTVEHLAR